MLKTLQGIYTESLADEETEALRNDETCPRATLQQDPNPGVLGSKHLPSSIPCVTACPEQTQGPGSPSPIRSPDERSELAQGKPGPSRAFPALRLSVASTDGLVLVLSPQLLPFRTMLENHSAQVGTNASPQHHKVLRGVPGG